MEAQKGTTVTKRLLGGLVVAGLLASLKIVPLFLVNCQYLYWCWPFGY